MQPFQNLRVTANARAVIRATYRATASFPRSEQFGLTAQLRRAAISIGLNISEGCGRESTKEFIRYLVVARSSGMEIEFGFLAAEDLEFGEETTRLDVRRELVDLQRQLSALITALRRR